MVVYCGAETVRGTLAAPAISPESSERCFLRLPQSSQVILRASLRGVIQFYKDDKGGNAREGRERVSEGEESENMVGNTAVIGHPPLSLNFIL